jgi:hypothetical protein
VQGLTLRAGQEARNENPGILKAMLTRLKLPPAIFFAVACVVTAQSNRFTGIVHPSLSPFEFRVHIDDKKDGMTEGFRAIDSVEVRSAGRPVQTIRFAGEETPIFRGPWKEVVSLRDVDCDGYKDLLVQISVGIHGDAWYHLYRFNQARSLFVEYPRFSSLPLKKIDCRNKLVVTYVNSGAAGCAYESGTYRWVDGELLPVRIESQEIATDGFTRVVSTWSNGKETIVKERVDGDDCHRAN